MKATLTKYERDWPRESAKAFDPAKHPRDDAGRFDEAGGGKVKPFIGTQVSVIHPQGSTAAIVKHFMSKLANTTPVPAKIMGNYKNSLKKAFTGFSDDAMREVARGVNMIKIIPQWKLNQILNVKQDDTYTGYYNAGSLTMAISDRQFNTYPVKEKLTSELIIAHEAAHAIDRQDQYSGSAEYKKIYKDEKMTDYAKINVKEGFAEAMKYTTCAYDQATLKRLCPLTHAYLVDRGLMKELKK